MRRATRSSSIVRRERRLIGIEVAALPDCARLETSDLKFMGYFGRYGGATVWDAVTDMMAYW